METSRPFGALLCDELYRQGMGSFLTWRLGYADIQRLKAADREACAKMFRGMGYDVVQRVRNDDPEDLARGLAGLLESEAARDALGTQGRVGIEKAYSWPRIAAATAEVYAEAIAERRRHPAPAG